MGIMCWSSRINKSKLAALYQAIMAIALYGFIILVVNSPAVECDICICVWNSLSSRFQMSNSLLKYFTLEDVLEGSSKEILKKCTFFEKGLIKPLMEKCKTMEFAAAAAEEDAKILCKSVKTLHTLLEELAEMKVVKMEDANIQEQLAKIFFAIIEDTIYLDIHYSKLIPANDAKRIWLHVANVRIENTDEKEGKEYEMQLRENFNEHYKKVAAKLIDYYRDRQQQQGNVGEQQQQDSAAMEASKTAYNLLQTSKFVGFEFDWSPAERIDYALQQFAVNTLIYGHRLGEGVWGLGQKWQIGMDNWVEKIIQRKLNLIEKSKKFDEKIVKILSQKCQNNKVRGIISHLKDGNKQKKKMLNILCETIGELEEPLKKLAEIAHRGQINANDVEIDKLFSKIHEIVLFNDIIGLDLHFAELLNLEVAKQIWIWSNHVRVKNIGDKDQKFKYVYQVRENLNEEFKESVKTLRGVISNGEDDLKVAYKIVQLAKFMGFEFDWSDAELFDWAMQQFAVNITIYGLYLQQQDMHAIGADWPIGMDEWM